MRLERIILAEFLINIAVFIITKDVFPITYCDQNGKYFIDYLKFVHKIRYYRMRERQYRMAYCLFLRYNVICVFLPHQLRHLTLRHHLHSPRRHSLFFSMRQNSLLASYGLLAQMISKSLWV